MEATFCPENGKSGKSLSLPLPLSSSLSLLLSLRAFKCWKRSADAREVQKPPQNLAGRPAISLPLWQRERQMRRRTRYENLHNTRNAFFGPFFAPPSPFPPEKYYNGVKRQMEYSVHRPSDRRPSRTLQKKRERRREERRGEGEGEGEGGRERSNIFCSCALRAPRASSVL